MSKDSRKKSQISSVESDSTRFQLPLSKSNPSTQRRSSAGRSHSLRISESKNNTRLFQADSWSDSEYDESPKLTPRLVLSRTSLYLLDFFQFRAARIIQTAWRGFFVRLTMERRNRAACVIQRAWRCLIAKRRYNEMLESKLQKHIRDYYNHQATIIQALWRGWWTRATVHDHYRLKRMQIAAAEELMYCVAFRLHHLLRTYQIPGIYSLRNSHCLSKVENFLAALTFKQYSDRVRRVRAQQEKAARNAKNSFPASCNKTRIPYSGPNYSELCIPKCCELYNEKDANMKMHGILKMYEKMLTEKALREKKEKSKKSKRLQKKRRTLTPTIDFCADVVNSMKRWNIVSPNCLKVDLSVFKSPACIEKFLIELQEIHDTLLETSCHCKISAQNAGKCEDDKEDD